MPTDPGGTAASKGEPQQTPKATQDKELERFLDVPIEVGVQLDRKLVSVREVLDLQVNSIVRMQRSAGENVDLLLNGVVIGNGEIVVIEDMMGLRVTDLGFPGEAREQP